MNVAVAARSEARIPLLYGPPMITLMFFSWQRGRNSESAEWSRRVYRPASRKQSKSSLASQPGLHFPLVHASAYRRNHPLRPQLRKGLVRPLHRLVEMVVRVMDQENVDVVQVQPFQAPLEYPHDRIVVVYVRHVPGRVRSYYRPHRSGWGGFQQPAHFGGYRETGTWDFRENAAVALLADASAIDRGPCQSSRHPVRRTC